MIHFSLCWKFKQSWFSFGIKFSHEVDAFSFTDENTPESGSGVWPDKRGFDSWSPIAGSNKKPVQPSGWEETAVPPPVTCQQSGGNYDDGTAVWGNPVHQGKVSHWKEMPPTKQMPNCVMPPGNMCGANNPCNGPGMIRLPPSAVNPNKNDNTWMKNAPLNRGLSWTDMGNRDGSGRRIWDELHNQLQDKNVPGTPNTPNSAFGNWGDSNPNSYWGTKTKNSSTAAWAEGQVDTSSWVTKQVIISVSAFITIFHFVREPPLSLWIMFYQSTAMFRKF